MPPAVLKIEAYSYLHEAVAVSRLESKTKVSIGLPSDDEKIR